MVGHNAGRNTKLSPALSKLKLKNTKAVKTYPTVKSFATVKSKTVSTSGDDTVIVMASSSSGKAGNVVDSIPDTPLGFGKTSTNLTNVEIQDVKCIQN